MTTGAAPEGLGLEFPPMLQEPSELGALIGLVEQNLGQHPRSVVEIGCWQGGTIARLRARWPLAAVIGVDVIEPAPVEGVHFVTGPSQSEAVQAQVQELLGWEPVDFVHIDGDHSLDACVSDAHWAMEVLKARMVALHDVAEWQNPHLEVWKLWHRLKLDSLNGGPGCVEIRHSREGVYGYGVVLNRG